ncbi:MAG: hypothetical protein CMO82_11315 [Winogradskyella sp.]|nr:hypothetical protein [Winogradskyella sp.]
MFLSQELLFDTIVDTKNIFVTIRTSLILHNYKNASGEQQILLRISCNGTERLPLGLYINPKDWNKKKQLALESSQELIDLNLTLKRELGKINDLQIFYRLSDIRPSIERVVRDYQSNLGFQDFNVFFKRILDERKPTINKSTYAKEQAIHNKLKAFRRKIPFSDIDRKFFFDFRNHLASIGNEKTTRNGNVKVLKKYLRYAVKFGVKLNIDLEDITAGPTKGQKNYLNKDEIKLLYDYYTSSFITKSKQICLGYFLTSCFTGLRISDILNQKRETLLNGYFQFTHVKTGKYQNMELNNKAIEIINHCDELFIKFYSAGHIRRTVKDIAAFVGITKDIDYHTSRHSFGTNAIIVGIDKYKLQHLMNHSDIKETEVYIHLAAHEQNTKADLLDNLW